MTVTLVFMVIGLICFIVGAANLSVPPVNWVALGLAFVTLATLLGGGVMKL